MANKNILKEVYDSLCSKLEAYALTLPSEQRYKLRKHSYRNTISTAEGMYVFLYVGQMNPTQKSGSNTFVQYKTEIIYDLMVVSKGRKTRNESNTTSSYENADALMGENVLVLLFNVLNAIFIHTNIDVLADPNQVQISSFPRVEPFFPDASDSPDTSVIGYRITLEPELVWEPIGAEGTTLESIEINLTGDNPSSSDIEYDSN